MREFGCGVYDPLSNAGGLSESPYRRMTVDDVNDLVEFTHQPYMYKKQAKMLRKRFHELGTGIPIDRSERSNQQAISVLRFALQVIGGWYGKGAEEAEEVIRLACSVGNVDERDCYRGEMRLRFCTDEEITSTWNSNGSVEISVLRGGETPSAARRQARPPG